MSTSHFIHTLLRPEVLALSAYHVAKADGLIKLDAMENPYSLPASLKEAWLARLSACEINRYPDPQAQQVIHALKMANQLPDSLDILLGNGSDEIIQLLLMALRPDAHIVSTTPSFVMYKQIRDALGLHYH